MISKDYRILIVEDDESIAEVLSLLLYEEGYIAPVAMNLSDAIMNIRGLRPDLILLDHIGYNDCKEILVTANVRQIPVILVTAKHGAKNLSEDLGIDFYLKKPFNIEVLFKLMLDVLRSDYGSNDQAARKAKTQTYTKDI